MAFEIGKTTAGYEVLEVLGSSKTGVAYKVRNVFAQRFEVLKILPKNLQDNEEQVARFLREIKVHARLVHPHIVTFYNAREIEGQLVMTTEYVPGFTVADCLEKGLIPRKEAVNYACHALSALECAHANGIVHRGLTPSNLVVTAEGIVRLSGFGLAKASSDPQLTAVGTVVGALRYISPEQVKGENNVDGRADIYALGVILYEMLTGKRPFDAKGQFETMLAHVNTPPKNPSDLNPQLPRELSEVVLRSLAKDPDQRYQTAAEFRGALERENDGMVVPSVAVAAAASNGAAQPAVDSVHSIPRQQPGQPLPAAAFSGDVATFLQQKLFSRLGISLAAGAITFLLGSAALLALLALTKP
jgi:serine/threonine-protein kinase